MTIEELVEYNNQTRLIIEIIEYNLDLRYWYFDAIENEYRFKFKTHSTPETINLTRDAMLHISSKLLAK